MSSVGEKMHHGEARRRKRQVALFSRYDRQRRDLLSLVVAIDYKECLAKGALPNLLPDLILLSGILASADPCRGRQIQTGRIRPSQHEMAEVVESLPPSRIIVAYQVARMHSRQTVPFAPFPSSSWTISNACFDCTTRRGAPACCVLARSSFVDRTKKPEVATLS